MVVRRRHDLPEMMLHVNGWVISIRAFSVNEIMRAHGGNMESRGKEDEGSMIIPGAAYRVTL